jgi:phosphoserine aminotransferase
MTRLGSDPKRVICPTDFIGDPVSLNRVGISAVESHAGGVSSDPATITIPTDLLPADGRFGCGPSKVRHEQVDAVVAARDTVLGTSHRKPAVKNLVGDVRSKLSTLFTLPDGWEILLGNGGSTAFWDIATFGLIEQRSQHLAFGEFSSKFSEAAAAAPHLREPTVIRSEAGTHPEAIAESGIDLYALTHNETSTGVSMQLQRPTGTNASDALVAVDATSGAGGLHWDPAEVDVYYFAPQKCFAADGGLWLAACSPAAIDRIESIGASNRWRPASLDLKLALDNSKKNQTYNTPAVATLVLLDSQLDWMLDNGGLEFAAGRSATSAQTLYEWAEARDWATPFVTDPAKRSNVVGAIDLDESIDAAIVSATLRANGILDTEGYRKLGRNQLRIGMFPAINPADIEALTACIDYVVK